MSNRDNGPELDYYELRRRHQEFKARQREELSSAPKTEPVSQAEPAPKAVPAPKAEPVEAPQELLHADAVQDAPIAAEPPVEEDPLASLVLSDEEPDEEEFDYEEEPDANPNPFDSFIRFFNGVKDNISARRDAKEAAELEALDEELTDEELAELNAEFDGLEDDLTDDELAALEADGPKPLWKRSRKAEEDPADDDDELEEDELEELEEDAPRKGGLKRFLNLFVSRVEEDEDEDEFEDEDAEDLELEEDHGYLEINGITERRGSHIDIDFTSGAHSKPEGGQIMDELNKPVSDTIQQMAEGLETSGMSRRERRERAMRLAAEEAARKAAEEEARKAELASFVSASEPAEETRVVEPLFADAEPEPASPVVEEEPAAEPELIVEEPTREFTPVSLRNLETMEEEKHNLFDVAEDEDSDEAEDDYDDEDEDDEDDDEEDTPRRGFFGFLRGRKNRDDDDEDEDDEDDDEDDEDLDDDDYDDEDEDDDDEDEDDEDDRPAKRRGLFGRRRKDEDEDDDDYDDEDEEEDDEEDDYDGEDEDEDDEYDEYEDDDEYDSYDDDKVHRSIGWHIVGVLKWVLRILFVLLVLVIGLNVLYITGTETIVPAAHDAMGDSTAFHLLFFSYDVRQNLGPADPMVVTPEVTEEETNQIPAEEPTAIPQPESTVAIPDFDTNGDITETPALDVAPVGEDNA